MLGLELLVIDNKNGWSNLFKKLLKAPPHEIDAESFTGMRGVLRKDWYCQLELPLIVLGGIANFYKIIINVGI
ncbi:hypothetical protein [Bartonella sp. CB178]|uniref:hypothetical protein n=1 Tax=Bartonella sp. CB178 TaxID=3112255 RepID=UPI00300DD707